MKFPLPQSKKLRLLGLAFCLAALVAGIAVFVSSSSSIKEPSELQVAFREGRLEEAQRVVDAWRARSPRSEEPFYWSARLALAGRQPKAFEVALKQAEELGLDQPRDELLKALSTALAGRFAEVEPRLRDAFNADPSDLLLMNALASGYLGTYDFPRASLVLDRWMAESPGDPVPYLRRAEIDLRKNDREALIVDYREALKRDPSLIRPRLGLAEALMESHRADEAALMIDSYLQINDADPAGRLCAGKIAAERGRNDEAVEHFERASTLDPKLAAPHKALGELLLRRNELDKALAQLEKAEALDPFDIDLHHNLGIVLTRLGRSGDAKVEQAAAARLRDELQTMLAAQSRLLKTPEHLDSQLEISRWMFAHGQEDQGRIWAETVLKDHPGDPEACRLLSEHYQRNGNTGLANYYRMQCEQ